MKTLLFLLIPVMVCGGYNQRSRGYNSHLYPPQPSLVQWLEGDSWSNVTARVGAEITFDGTSLIQTNFQAALPSIEVFAGTYTVPYAGTLNGKPQYRRLEGIFEREKIYWNGSYWMFELNISEIGTNSTTSTFPPTSGWSGGTVAYTSIWVDAGEFAEVVESELQALPGNTNNILNIYTYSSAPPSYIGKTITNPRYSGVYEATP